ncbi:hypothetical protein HZB02_00460 [Candidatus Woesearchaeota archaeon]|nr:hypothetical protein [Candidatus Woesearchaeota archaeon]
MIGELELLNRVAHEVNATEANLATALVRRTEGANQLIVRFKHQEPIATAQVLRDDEKKNGAVLIYKLAHHHASDIEAWFMQQLGDQPLAKKITEELEKLRKAAPHFEEVLSIQGRIPQIVQDLQQIADHQQAAENIITVCDEVITHLAQQAPEERQLKQCFEEAKTFVSGHEEAKQQLVQVLNQLEHDDGDWTNYKRLIDDLSFFKKWLQDIDRLKQGKLAKKLEHQRSIKELQTPNQWKPFLKQLIAGYDNREYHQNFVQGTFRTLTQKLEKRHHEYTVAIEHALQACIHDLANYLKQLEHHGNQWQKQHELRVMNTQEQALQFDEQLTTLHQINQKIAELLQAAAEQSKWRLTVLSHFEQWRLQGVYDQQMNDRGNHLNVIMDQSVAKEQGMLQEVAAFVIQRKQMIEHTLPRQEANLMHRLNDLRQAEPELRKAA